MGIPKQITKPKFDRLSELEKQVISLLARESQPVDRIKLLENDTIPLPDLANALQSLSRRCLIINIIHNQDLRTLTKETGFLPNLPTATTYLGKKPGFWAPMRPGLFKQTDQL